MPKKKASKKRSAKKSKKPDFAAFGRQGGKIGGKKRFEGMSEEERKLYAIRNAYLRLQGQSIKVWTAEVVTVDGARFSVIGGGIAPDDQFRRFRPRLPVGAVLASLHIRHDVAENFPALVEQLWAKHSPIEWGQRSSISVFAGKLEVHQRGESAPDILARWNTRRAPGRPKKVAE